jgi:hypothetical protein
LFWYLWPISKLDMVAHDSYFCQYYTSPYNRPWPVQRLMKGEGLKRNFVGSTWYGDKLVKMCPYACRPKEHPEWEFC